MKELAEQVKSVARSLKVDVNKERVARHAQGGFDLKTETWMIGEYLNGRRPVRVTGLLNLLENGESISETAKNEIRDGLIVQILMTNARRPGDMGFIRKETIDAMTIPEEGEDASFYIEQHKEARHGKKCPVMLSRDLAIDLKRYHDFISTTKKSPWLFTTRSGEKIEPSLMSKCLKTEWTRFQADIGQELPDLNASLIRKLAVTTLRESGGTREEQEVLALHMAHNLSTADKYYSRAEKKGERHRVLKK